MRTIPGRFLLHLLLAVTSVVGFAGPSSAQTGPDRWTITPFTTRGVDPDVAETFRELLQSELSARRGAAFVQATASCSDVPCARAVGGEIGAQVAIYGALNALGAKIIVTVTVVDVAEGTVLNSNKMAVDRVEDLEAVSTRMADAILSGRSTDDTAALGAITHQEAKPAVRREGDIGFAFGVGGVVPLVRSLGDAGFGMNLDFSFWYEAPHFAIEPRVGVRFSAEERDGGRYVQVPFDVAAYYILGLGDVAFLFGGGGGGRWTWEEHRETVVVGDVTQTSHTKTVDDNAWGFGLFARVGVLLFRTYSVRMSVSVSYDVTFAEVGGRYPQAFTFGLGVIF